MADLKLVVDTSDLKTAKKDLDAFNGSMSNLTVNRYVSSLQSAQGSIRQLAQAKANGVITQKQYSRGLLEIRDSLQKLGMTTAQAQTQIKSYLGGLERQTTLMQRNTRGINNMGVQMQQAGYQIGDFIVQVQSGTNAFVAFGQQATQVAGTLTLLGGKWIAIGSALGIAIPLLTALGAAYVRTRQEQDETSESVEKLEERLKSLDETVEQWLRTKRAASMGITVDELIGGEGLEESRRKLEELTNGMRDFFGAQAGELLGTEALQAELDAIILMMSYQSEEMTEVFRLRNLIYGLEQKSAEERVRAFSEELNNLNSRLEMEKEIARYGEDSEQVKTLEVQQRLEAYNRTVDEQVRLNRYTEAQGEALKRVFADVVNVEESTRRAADEASRYAEAMSRGFIGPGPQTMLPVTYGPVQGPNLPDPDKPSRGGGGRKQSLEDILKLRAEQIVQEERIARLSGETARIEEIKVEIQRQYGRKLTATQAKAVEAAAADIAAKEQTIKSLQDLKAEQESLASTIESSMEDAFMSIVDGTKSTEDAFKDMARSIIAQLYRVLVVQRLVGDVEKGTGLAGLLGNFLGARESGGSVRSGGSYLVGERGPELFTPGRSGTITSNNLMKSGGQQEVAVRVYVDNDGNFQAMVDQRANKAIANAAPTIVNQSVGAVVERTKRGGSMKSTFK